MTTTLLLQGNENVQVHFGILSALNLYLDFINLFCSHCTWAKGAMNQHIRMLKSISGNFPSMLGWMSGSSKRNDVTVACIVVAAAFICLDALKTGLNSP